jgi:hypothetical protein
MNTRKNPYDTSSSAKPNTKEEFEKKNPKSLTSVLLYIRSYFFGSGLSRKLFSEYLDIRTKRNYAKTISEDVLEKLERDKTTATYAHIERYADFLEIPTAIIFLISRITSDIEKNNINDLAQMAEGLEEISQYLKRNLDVLSKREKKDDYIDPEIMFEIFSLYKYGEVYGQPIKISKKSKQESDDSLLKRKKLLEELIISAKKSQEEYVNEEKQSYSNPQGKLDL